MKKKVHEDETLITATVDQVAEGERSISEMAYGCGAPHVMVVQPYIQLRKTVQPEEVSIVAPFEYRIAYTAKLRVLFPPAHSAGAGVLPWHV